MMGNETHYQEKKQRAIVQFQQLLSAKQKISLKEKKTSHFFRPRVKKTKLNLLDFRSVVSLNTDDRTAEVEGLINFYDLAEETLPFGLMPAVVPELRALTVGGVISGIGVEATSFEYGLFHETLLDFELLTASGEVLYCSPKENKDLFYTVPNALGTLGYVLKAKIKLIPVQPYVKVTLQHFSDVETYFRTLEKLCHEESNIDFLDGVIFHANHGVIMVGTFVSQLPVGKKVFEPLYSPYFQILQDTSVNELYFTIKEYLWRWDYDCFWGTKRKISFLGEILLHPLFRRTLGKHILRSDRLLTLRRKVKALQLPSFLRPVVKEREETLLQDAGVPIKKCATFINWYNEHIQIYPLWICPAKAQKTPNPYPLSHWSGQIVVDIGFYSGKKLPPDAPDNYYNRKIEKYLNKLGAMKGLYSTSFYTKEEFWQMFDQSRYTAAKKKYDPGSVFPELYQKAVGYKTL